CARGHAQSSCAGRGGQPGTGPGLPGGGDPPAELGSARDLHGAQVELRGRGGAHVSGALTGDRQDRGGYQGGRAPGEALLPAQSNRKSCQNQGKAATFNSLSLGPGGPLSSRTTYDGSDERVAEQQTGDRVVPLPGVLHRVPAMSAEDLERYETEIE